MRKIALLLALLAIFVARGAEPEAAGGKVQFAWGAEFGSSIDLSGHDMSTVDFSANVGVRHSWLTLAGVGVGANLMVSNSCRTYPVFAIVRTSFSTKPKILFMDLRGGVALNYFTDNLKRTSPYVSAGVGFNLATGRTFTSYLIAAYTFNSRGHVETPEIIRDYEPLHFAGIRLGIEF